jgi:P27 family predicted phage terminase small subunit
MRGRKPKPTYLKLISGNPGRRPLNENEPAPRLALPSVPPHLSDEAKVEWGRVANEMYDLGMLTHLDRAVLASYCQYYATWCKFTELADRHPLMKGSKGQPVVSSYMKLANQAYQNMLKAAVELGITPSARSRVSAVPPKDNADPARKYLE